VSKIPGNHNSNQPLRDTRAPLSNEGKEKRTELMRRQHQHKRVASLTTGKVKKTEAPPKADKTGWTDKMREKLNVLLAKLNAGLPSVSDFIASVHDLFGKRGYQHGDRQVIAEAVVKQTPDRQQNIAQNATALLAQVAHDLLTVTVVNDIVGAIPKVFVPQTPSTPPSTPKPFTAIDAQIPPNPLSGLELRNWEHRGATAMNAFLTALAGTDEQAKLDAFFGSKSVKGLWEVIKEVTDKTDHADVSELEGWIDCTLKDRSKQEIESIVKSLKEGFGAKGDIYFNVRARLFRQADLLRRKEAGWNARGMRHTKQVVAALLAGDTQELKGAFYDPGYDTKKYGEDPKLYEMIKDEDAARQRESFDRWVGEALKGCSRDNLNSILETINENAETRVCPRGGVFKELEGVLRQNIEECRLADEFVSTVLKGGDIGQAADRFGLRVRAVTGSDSQLTQARMVALIAAKLANVPVVEIATLKERCRDLPA
jgi:hypothetical protein